MSKEISTLTFDEIEIGLKKSFEIIISENMLDSFSELTGDFNPLHMDKEYANSIGFDERVCNGMLLGSFFSRLIGMYLPGKNALYFSQSLNFVNPCLLNEKILVEGEIMDKSEATKIIRIKTTIIRLSQNSETEKIIVDGIARVKIRND